MSLVIIGVHSPETESQALPKNRFSFDGAWTIAEEYASPHPGGQLNYRFMAKNVYLVMRPQVSRPTVIRIFLDDQLISNKDAGKDVISGTATVSSDSLHELVNLESPGKHVLRLEFTEGR